MAKKARVYDGTAWQELASAQTDLTAYSTTAQMNTAIESTKRLLQNLNFTTSAYASGTTTIPRDDTIPQITEGTQFLSLAITPQSATSLLEITATLQLVETTNVDDTVVMCLFRDAVANALSVSSQSIVGTPWGPHSCTLTYTMTAGTTSEIIFRIRAGLSNAGTCAINGLTGRLYGGVMNSFITIKEYTA
jgi:hypothetical protein